MVTLLELGVKKGGKMQRVAREIAGQKLALQ
jgi:hypothetical protein